MITQALQVFGLSLTLIGAGLLFFYGMPMKQFGKTVIYGGLKLTIVEPNNPSVSQEELQSRADVFHKHAKRYNREGFGLIAIGTFFQIVAVYV